MSDLARHERRGWWPALPWGEAAIAALLIAIASGVAVAIPYDPSDPLMSVATMVLANPAAAWFRNIHYWTTQAFLLLSLGHAWDHVRRRDARPLRLGAWLRVCLTLPAIGLVAWSGFVLKGDVESLQALRVVTATIQDVPGIGPLVALALFGRDERLFLIYVHHVATFTLFVWIVAVEHGRVMWPRTGVTLAVLVPAAVLSLMVAPALHDGLSGAIKGPWYFVGLQEAFHWSPWPRLVVMATLVPLVALFVMRWMTPGARQITGYALVAVTVGYAGLTGVAWAFRGANWTWTDAWRTSPASLVLAPVFATPDPAGEPLRGRALPVVMGRPEGCLVCHAGVTGLSASHAPSTIGCASCHLGNVFSLDAKTAHAGMRVVPGNLVDAGRTCGGECHQSIVERIERSLMTTNAGIVAVNRLAWGEGAHPATPTSITEVGFTPADGHARQLCATCHLGQIKREPWPVTEESRGGGCTACHVSYSAEAQAALERYRSARERGSDVTPPTIHPNVALPSDNMPCFGCHSRSGRISLSYEGWHEANPVPPAGPGVVLRRLDDGRDVVQVSPDAHATKGMLCIDCHTAREVMGDGARHARQLDQLHVKCEDCHPTEAPRIVPFARADEQSRRIVSLRALPTDQRPLLLSTAGDAFANAFVHANGSLRLLRKKDARPLELKPPRPECRDAVHGRVSCIGCHTAWAPRCPTCHTGFDPNGQGYDHVADREVKGEWVESGDGFTAVPPTLGLRRVATAGATTEVFEPFIPGMVATLDARHGNWGLSPFYEMRKSAPVVRRWYSRTFSHTVTRAGRTCVSCHNDPVALGYGEGRLEFVAVGEREGRWRFIPTHAATADGLPSDAWIGFLQSRSGSVSTRDDVRPLTTDEQRRLLAVGACLTCHTGDSSVMRESLTGFDRALARMTASCRRAIG